MDLFDLLEQEEQTLFKPPDARNEAGTLLCICGKPQQWYSGRLERGICSEECFKTAVKMNERNEQ